MPLCRISPSISSIKILFKDYLIPKEKKINKKRDEGKPHKLVVVACINKLIHWIYALFTRGESFQDVA